MHGELVAMVSLSSLLSERSQVMQVWEHGLESSDSLWEAWHTMWRNLSFPPGISDCPLKRMDVLRELQGCFVQRFLHCMAYELLALYGAETKAANRVALREKSGPTQGSKKGYIKRKGDKLEGCGEKRKVLPGVYPSLVVQVDPSTAPSAVVELLHSPLVQLPDAERVQPPDAHAAGPQDAEHLAPDVVTAPQPKKAAYVCALCLNCPYDGIVSRDGSRACRLCYKCCNQARKDAVGYTCTAHKGAARKC
eukprot:gene15627-21732_t